MTVRYLNEADANASDPAATPDSDARQSTREELGRYADQGGFTMTTETHPWLEAAETVTSPEDARAASTVLAELRSRDIRAIGSAVTGIAGKAGLDVPDTLAGLKLLLEVLQRVQRSAAALRSEAYEADLDALTAATGTGRWRKQQGVKVSWGRRRALRAEARGLAVGSPGRRDLHTALVEAVAARTDWASLATDEAVAARPVVPVDGELLAETAQAVEALGEAVTSLGRLLTARTLEAQPLGELAELVDLLAADEGTLYRLSARRNLREALAAEGLTELLDELAERQADRDAALSAYDRHAGTDGEDAARQALAAGPRTAEPEAAEEEAEAAETSAEPVAEAAPVEAEVEVEATVDAEAEVEQAEAEVEPVVETAAEEASPAEVEPVIEETASAVAEVEAVAESVVAEPVVEADAAEEASPEAEPVAEVAPVEVEAEAVAESVVAEPVVEADAAEEASPEAEPVAEVVAEVAPVEVEVEETASAVAEVEAAPVEAVAVELSAEPVVEADAAEEASPEAEPVAEVVAEVAPVEVEVEETASAVAEAEPVVEEPALVVAAAPEKPDFTPGRPITAYEPAELVALVRWLDADGAGRSDDELLRAAMKELGFARLGPRIKEALGAAVAEARS